MLLANQVNALAARSDLQGVSPHNRMTTRTASLLAQSTGVTNLRTTSGTSYTGPDGAGMGIARLDSGIMLSYKAMLDAIASGKTSEDLLIKG